MADARPILVIEDDSNVRTALASVLQHAGYEVLTASDGEEGLACLRQACRPRLILLDVLMPGMGGFRFRAEQLKEPAFAEVPVVLLTGDADVSRTYSELGALQLLIKPIDPQVLLSTVASYTD